MSKDENKKIEMKEDSTNPYDWMLGFEFITTIVVLLASAAGYLVLK